MMQLATSFLKCYQGYDPDVILFQNHHSGYKYSQRGKEDRYPILCKVLEGIFS